MNTPHACQRPKRRRIGDGSTDAPGLCALRVPEIERVFRHRWDDMLPDDDAGRDDLNVLLVHVLRFSNGHEVARSFIRRWAPWMPAADAAAAIEKAASTFTIGSADEVAERFRLTYEERQKLGITTIGAIDCGPVERERRRKERHAARQRARRRERKQDMAERRGKALARLDLSPRAGSLFDRLASGRWLKLPEVERSWTEGEVGGLSQTAKHMAVWRAVRELARVGLVDIRTGKIGQPAEVRRVADAELTAANTACYRNKARNAAKSAPQTERPEQSGNACAAGTFAYNTESVRSAQDAHNTAPVRTARDAACAPYSYNYGVHAAGVWTFRTYDVRLSVDGIIPSAGGAPEAPPGPSTANVSDVTGDETVLAEPNPISITDVLSPRAPTGARAGMPQPIQLDPTTGEFWPDTAPGPQTERALDCPVVWPFWTDRARPQAA